jgi:hypothetical protein
MLDETTNKNSTFIKEYEKISDSKKEDVVGMIDNIIKNLNDLSESRDFFEVYFKNITDTIGLKDLTSIANNIKLQKPYLPQQTVKIVQPTTSKATKIINKDDFSLPSPMVDNTERIEKNQIEKKLMAHSKTVIPDEVRIIEDDEFDH